MVRASASRGTSSAPARPPCAAASACSRIVCRATRPWTPTATRRCLSPRHSYYGTPGHLCLQRRRHRTIEHQQPAGLQQTGHDHELELRHSAAGKEYGDRSILRGQRRVPPDRPARTSIRFRSARTSTRRSRIRPQPGKPLPDNFLRPYYGWGSITTLTNGYNSNYHSLQVSAQRRFSGGLQLGVAYTFSKALDVADGDTSAVSPYFAPRFRNYGRAGLRPSAAVRGQLRLLAAETRHQDELQGRPSVVLDNWEVSAV